MTVKVLYCSTESVTCVSLVQWIRLLNKILGSILLVYETSLTFISNFVHIFTLLINRKVFNDYAWLVQKCSYHQRW